MRYTNLTNDLLTLHDNLLTSHNGAHIFCALYSQPHHKMTGKVIIAIIIVLVLVFVGYQVLFKQTKGKRCSFNWECGLDGECVGGFFSKLTHRGICEPTGLGSYKACEENSQCLSGECNHIRGEGQQCCPPGSEKGGHPYGGFDYCTNLPEGKPCWSPDMCASGACENGTCQPGDLPEFAACYENTQCQSGKCNHIRGEGQQCCPPGSEVGGHMYGAFYYCTNLPEGKPCWSPDMCASGACEHGTCQPGDLPEFASCSENTQCQSGKCNHIRGEGQQCCPPGSEVGGHMYGAFYYCTDLPEGKPCWSPDMCASGACENGTCQPKGLPEFAACYENTQCQSGKCNYIRGEGQQCCPPGSEKGGHPYGFYHYCTELPKGKPCWSDDMCASGDCDKVCK
jgi:hypothetical protein